MSTRPEILFPLFAALTSLDGVGPKTAEHMDHLGVTRPRDLLLTLPASGIDRSRKPSVRDVVAPTTVTVEVTVQHHSPAAAKGRPYRVAVEDEQTVFHLVFFHARAIT